MISTNDFQTGLTIEFEGELYSVLEFQHVKPGKGAAFVRSKLKNLRSGSIIEHTFRAGEKVPKAHLERKEMEYLYRDEDFFYLMDLETYEQLSMPVGDIGSGAKYLKENDRLNIVMYGDEVIGVDLPVTVTLQVTDTEPGIKGDTASGASKPATLETGLVVQVPIFINSGDLVKVDTRSGEYIERA
ncbi:MAG: elongation factor P [Bacillota bacterium]